MLTLEKKNVIDISFSQVERVYHLFVFSQSARKCLLRKQPIIMGRGGACLENGKIAGPKRFAPPPPPPSRQDKTFKILKPPSVWLKPQAHMLKLPQNSYCSPPLFFVRVKLALPFCSPSPLPIINDRSQEKLLLLLSSK